MSEKNLNLADSIVELPNGVRVFNSTPHLIRFWDEGWEEPVEVPPSGVVISATVEEKTSASPSKDVIFVTPSFVGNNNGMAVIAAIQSIDLTCVIVGSIIAAQAYPGRVVAMVPATGFERVPPAEKRMRPDKFAAF